MSVSQPPQPFQSTDVPATIPAAPRRRSRLDLWLVMLCTPLVASVLGFFIGLLPGSWHFDLIQSFWRFFLFVKDLFLWLGVDAALADSIRQGNFDRLAHLTIFLYGVALICLALALLLAIPVLNLTIVCGGVGLVLGFTYVFVRLALPSGWPLRGGYSLLRFTAGGAALTLVLSGLIALKYGLGAGAVFATAFGPLLILLGLILGGVWLLARLVIRRCSSAPVTSR